MQSPLSTLPLKPTVRVSRRIFRVQPALALVAFLLVGATGAHSQVAKPQQPEVRINYLNVCTPADEDIKEMLSALNQLPAPKFTNDFEISRGRSTTENAPTANWVRLRREFPASASVVAAQYSLTVDEKAVIETLVFRSREAKDVLQVQLEDTVTGAQDAKSVLATDTPVNRIKLERFGKASNVLARCPAADQTAYEPIFKRASSILASYRAAMSIKKLVPRELAMLAPVTVSSKTKGATKN